MLGVLQIGILHVFIHPAVREDIFYWEEKRLEKIHLCQHYYIDWLKKSSLNLLSHDDDYMQTECMTIMITRVYISRVCVQWHDICWVRQRHSQAANTKHSANIGTMLAHRLPTLAQHCNNIGRVCWAGRGDEHHNLKISINTHGGQCPVICGWFYLSDNPFTMFNRRRRRCEKSRCSFRWLHRPDLRKHIGPI